jgi:exosome complex component RRP4
VVRSRRQVWTVSTGNGGGEVDVVLGVNGYIWISKHVASEVDPANVSITRLEENVASSVYSSQNDEISPQTRREIARLAGCIRALVEGGVRVDEDMVMRAYEASLDVDTDEMIDVGDNEGSEWLGGDRGARVVAAALASARA